jgi:hypothetical protein
MNLVTIEEAINLFLYELKEKSKTLDSSWVELQIVLFKSRKNE